MAFIKISGLPRYQRLPNPCRENLQAPTSGSPALSWPRAGSSCWAWEPRREKKGKRDFFFFLQACLGRWVFHGQFQHSPRDPAFYNKVLLGGNLKALHKPYMLIKQHIKI